MKTIQGKGYATEEGQQWLAVVPDDATSSQDPRRMRVLAPEFLDQEQQAMWLEGYAGAVQQYAAMKSIATVVCCGCIVREHDAKTLAIDMCPLHLAAPDLLAACKRSLVEFTAMRASGESIQDSLIREVETAIAKAEGTTDAPAPS
jgi:hypothetical protein